MVKKLSEQDKTNLILTSGIGKSGLEDENEILYKALQCYARKLKENEVIEPYSYVKEHPVL